MKYVKSGALAVAIAAGFELSGLAQAPVFRTGVEVIAVDVQVIDKDGNPISKIDPNAFEVTITGRKHKVTSATFIRHTDAPIPQPARPPVPLTSLFDDGAAATLARTVILAVDSGSFEPGDTQAAMDAARGFLKRLEPTDLVGLYVFPSKMWIAPTTQRAVLDVRLANLVGEKQPLRSYYNLKPHEIVDVTAQSTNPNSFLSNVRNATTPAVGSTTPTGTGPTAGTVNTMRALDPVLKIQARECAADVDCPIKIWAEGIALATQLEREAQLSMSGLDSLLRLLGELPGRKAVVLVTGGLLVSDRLDGRPDPGTVARGMGQAAARVNATIYTIHVDPHFANPLPASRSGSGELGGSRDRAMLGNWLEDFSRVAGGRRIDVPVGGGEFAFDRVLRETSAYYLLGVEPTDVDRDGQAHELRVKVDRRGVTVRNRQWVVIPPRMRQ